MRTIAHLIKQTFADWLEDKAPRLGAALAYYAIFSIPPLMILIMAIAGLLYGDEVQVPFERQVRILLGEETAKGLMDTMRQQGESHALAGIFGFALLVLGASGLFGQLQDAMNTIWEVKPKGGRGIIGIIKERFLSFTMVLGTGFLLLVSLMLTTIIAAVVAEVPGAAAVARILELVLSLAVITLLFAMIFKILPDVKIAWSDVWIGAGVTALLFVLGEFLMGLYFGKARVSSAYGAAGPFIIMVIWVYYSAQILFLGAEFTQVYANRFGSRVLPAENAESVTSEQRAQEGMSAEVMHESDSSDSSGETRAS